MFIAVERLWKCQEDKAAQPRGNKETTNWFSWNTIETEELNKEADKVKKPEDAAELIKYYEEILWTKRKGVISVAYCQGKLFSWFHEKEKFTRLVADFGVHKGTIIFKINVFKLLDKYTKLKKSSVTQSFMKNYFKDIKQVCKESSDFE